MRLLCILFSLLALSSCGSSIYEQFNKLPGKKWSYKQPQQFTFHLTEGTYSVRLDLQNTDDYPYENLWIATSVNGPDGVTVAGLNNYSLAFPDGEWKGSGPGGLYDLPVDIGDDFTVKKSGDYTFTLVQSMRQDELDGVNGIGIRLRKL